MTVTESLGNILVQFLTNRWQKIYLKQKPKSQKTLRVKELKYFSMILNDKGHFFFTVFSVKKQTNTQFFFKYGRKRVILSNRFRFKSVDLLDSNPCWSSTSFDRNISSPMGVKRL